MRAVVYDETGASSVLQVVDRDVPEPHWGELRVRLAVAGVNPTDWKARSGATGPGSLPFDEVVPGQDGAGVVDAVGNGASGVSAGERVWVYLAQHQRPTGTAQEYTVVPSDRVVRLGSASYDVGASLGVPAMTAHRALTVHEDGPDRLSPGALEGRTILVTGGAGAVGHAAIQLAVWAGGTVITTISSDEKAALATAAGAQHTVNYRDDDAAAQVKALAPDGVDIVVDVAAADNAELVGQVLANRGVVSIYADNGAKLELQVRPSMVLNARLQFILLYTVGDDALRAAAEDVSAAVADGALEVGEEYGLPLVRFPLEQAADAHDAVENGAVGKVLIDIADLD
ncbi:MAG: NADPH:quinone reductase [Nocardioides sp.]